MDGPVTLTHVPVRWRLKQFLAENLASDGTRLTINRVAVASGIMPNSLYPIARGDAKQANLETINKLLEALAVLVNRQVLLPEILEHVPDESGTIHFVLED